MDETYGSYVDDEWFGLHDYDDDTDHDADDDADTDDDTGERGRGNRRPLLGGTEFISSMTIYDGALILEFLLAWLGILEEIRTWY